MTRDELIEDLKTTGDGKMNVVAIRKNGTVVKIEDVGYDALTRSVAVRLVEEEEEEDED